MTTSEITSGDAARSYGALSANLCTGGKYITLYAIALIFVWIGAMKFTAYEAAAIEGLVASSPFVSWLYPILGQRGAAALIGVIEISGAILLFARPWSPRAGIAGAAIVLATTATTVSFLFSAPGWEPSLGGFPALSVVPGQFLLKDIAIFGAALWIAGDAYRDIT
ncbi:YkgB family protein [Hoeflea sp. TYP-13]|uniref:YkgB family protein n=1 Tax=Hoeflea sp. TYP-13 TaxID=3230023 RepID=UPI0034C5DDD8